jgi:hypothetical protein
MQKNHSVAVDIVWRIGTVRTGEGKDRSERVKGEKASFVYEIFR